jgi:Sec-independent protein translocase protein TatA
MIGLWEILGILVLVAIIYFIGKKAPGLARNTGRSISEFKQGIKNIPEEMKKGMAEKEKKPAKKKTSTKKKSVKKK